MMTIPAALAIPFTAPLGLGAGMGVMGFIGLAVVGTGFTVLIARMLADCTTDGTPRDTTAPDPLPNHRSLQSLRQAA
ncbi:MAG TPA: hypothetical protein VGR62_00615 [Candidatus Binatia bacterium]|jgi:hypothetical protein|nr:hypothetical protein [Candidatus Binatia bacterium]